MDMSQLQDQYSWMVTPLVQSGVIIVLAFGVLLLLKRIFDAVQPRVPVPKMIFQLFRRVVRVFVYLLTLSVILSIWGVNLNTVLTMIGGVLAMVAIGFVAVWSLLSNLLCAFVLITFRPFRIGDEVEIIPENVKGQVVDLTLLYTSLKTEAGDHFRVPNNLFFQKIFRCREGSKTSDLGDQLMQDKPAA
ncbi:MAG TPA: mechanosensitive ion channel family protein [Verrucomicrobiales bacterium]|nr:mechanosensitive ion channel family protein [Verrucomicrobiales bacterium]